MCDKLSFDLSSTSLRVVLTTLSVKVYFNTKPYIQFLREMVISLYNLERMNERKLPYFLLTLESDSSIILFERISDVCNIYLCHTNRSIKCLLYKLLICGAVVLFVLFSIAEFMNSVGGQVYLYFWLAVEVGTMYVAFLHCKVLALEVIMYHKFLKIMSSLRTLQKGDISRKACM